MLKVINVVGARPNFMKVAPIVAVMKRRTDDFPAARRPYRPTLRLSNV